MTEKLRRIGLMVIVLAGTYLGLDILFWAVVNFRFFTAAFQNALELTGFVITVIYLLVLLSSLVPSMILKKLKVVSLWPFILTGVLSFVNTLLLFAVLVSFEFVLGMILPKGPSGEVVPTLMAISPKMFAKAFGGAFGGFLAAGPFSIDWQAMPKFSAFFAIPLVCGGLFWRFLVHHTLNSEQAE